MENNNQEVVKPKSHLVLIIVVGVILIVGTYLLFKLVLNKDTTSEVEEGTISFDSTSYSCIEGQDLEATITVEGGMVKEYNSSNPLVASIRKHPFKSVKCANCVLVEIKCSRKGEATLSTASTKGAKAEAKLLVIEKGLIDINFEKDKYTCNVGDKFHTMITTKVKESSSEEQLSDFVKSYESNNRDVVEITESKDLAVDCTDCVMVDIYCKAKGTAKLTAKSRHGAKISVPITVN